LQDQNIVLGLPKLLLDASPANYGTGLDRSCTFSNMI
jgi:hypothetical protein